MGGKVVCIFISENAGEPMRQVTEIEAMAHRGLKGDRYANEKGSFSNKPPKASLVGGGKNKIRQVSLIEKEVVDDVNTGLEIPFHLHETRRNIVVENFPLNHLVGKEFIIGDVRMRGAGHCTPCQRPSQLCGKKDFKEAFRDQGGLRAEVLNSGIIRENDDLKIIKNDVYKVGDSVSYTTNITSALISEFAQLSGDTNPIHLNSEYASKTRFKKCVAHGLLLYVVVSKILGTQFPGPGAILLSVSAKFLKPTFPGDCIKFTVTVSEIRSDKPIMKFSILAKNQKKEIVTEGEVTLLIEPV